MSEEQIQQWATKLKARRSALPGDRAGGFVPSACLLETIVLVLEGGEELVAHATPARRKCLDLLP